MNILLFTLEYPPFRGGVANYYGNLVKHWPEPDNIFVLDNSNSQLLNNKSPFLKWLPAIKELWKIIREKKIDQVLVGQILPLGTVVYLISFFIKIRFSVILHGMDFTYAIKSQHKKRLTRKILARAECVICGNNYTAGLVKDFLDDNQRDKVRVVNPGVEGQLIINNEKLIINELIQKYNLDNKVILLTVGRLVKRKGIDMVLETLPDILKEMPDLVYAIVGSGEELDNYKLLIINYKLENNVVIVQDASDEERDAWYQACDIFIMPARRIGDDFEGFGIVYLEANLRGKPVIAGASGGIGDAVVDGVNGLLVNPENTLEIKNAIIKLAQNKDLRNKLGEAGRKRAQEEFNWDAQVKRFRGIFN
jgi:phosphatidylinositol alpha-1,6-mannosyltransferase